MQGLHTTRMYAPRQQGGYNIHIKIPTKIPTKIHTAIHTK